MESDKKNYENIDLETEPPQEHNNNVANSGNIFQSFRVRRSISSCDEVDRVLLDYGRNFLLPVGIVLWIILLAA
jgi:hypothetical protein